MGLLTWLKDPGLRGELLWIAISADDPEESARGMRLLREKGWLTDSSLRGVDLHEAILAGADLSGADLEDADFRQSDLHGADFTGANLRWAVFDSADLTGANFRDADLRGAHFAGAELQGANFTGADLGGASLRFAELDGANLAGALFDSADLSGTELSEDQLFQVSTLAGATMPDDFAYDGRYNLSGDLDDALELGLDPGDAEAMAAFYGASPARYQEGQDWAKAHKRARKSSGGKKAAAKPADADIGEPVGEDDEDCPQEAPGVSMLDLIEWPFEDFEALKDYLGDDAGERKARILAAWLAVVLLWLPSIIYVLQVAAASLQRQNGTLFTRTVMIVAALLAPPLALAGWPRQAGR